MNKGFKKFVSYYAPYKGLFVTVLLAAVAQAGLLLLMPQCIKYITGEALSGGAQQGYERIIAAGGVMLAILAAWLVCSTYSDYCGHVLGAKMERDIRAELFAHYQKLSFSFYDNSHVGKLMSRVTTDLNLLAETYHHAPEDIIIYTIKCVGAFAFMLAANWQLALIVFAFLPPLALFTYHFAKKMRAAVKDSYDKIGDINAQVEESLSGQRTVKAFANENAEIEQFSKGNRLFYESRKRIYWNETVCYQGMEIFVRCMTIAVAVFGGLSVLGQRMDLPELVAFLLYTGLLTEPISYLIGVMGMWQNGLAGYDRFIEMMETQPDIVDKPGAVEPHIDGAIELKDVSFRYKGRDDLVLRDVSLKVNKGEFVALVGHSGVGKTTLCSLIPRFYEPESGAIYIDGVNVADMKLDWLRNNIGIVQQDVYLFSGTVMENIAYGKPGASEAEIIAAAKMAHAHEFVANLPEGYDTQIGQRGIKLSGGQKQRLAIARVFLKNPPILIFDEATSALDNESEGLIRESLELLAKNRTTIVIAHRLSTIKNAGRIIVMHSGGIAEQGSHDELLAKEGVYASLYV